MNQISITLNNSELTNVTNKLEGFHIENKNENILHIFKKENWTITIYKTNVMVIQGLNSEEAYKFIFNKTYNSTDVNKIDIFNNNKEVNQNYISTVGSDEVGVGDFFGGIVVCAAYVERNQIEWLKEIGVKDSKKLTDQQMLIIFEKIKEEIKHEVISYDASDYNKMFNQYENSHIIKSVGHNQALWNLSQEVKRPYFVIIDEFASHANYSKYLRIANKTEFTIDIFEKHAEDKYIAVACASIIARVYFLKQIQMLQDNLKLPIPLGSSNQNIKDIASHILNMFGQETLESMCKKHFITFKEIVGY